MNTWHIHIKGQVQGVGFRPFVYLLAKEHGLTGWVNNDTDGVHIEINAEESRANLFFNSIVNNAPNLSRITGYSIFKTEQKTFDYFQIIHSSTASETNLLLTPDFALCSDCKSELYTQGNRRKGYPFITCTNCGPRYSIVQKLPYDRENTAMYCFSMCQHCTTEYKNPVERRYYSQTNSCPDCAVELSLFDCKQQRMEILPDKIIDKVVQLWRQGKIVAIKGIGGYLLTCDAANEQTIQLLRQRKNRPSKPLALMYPNATAIRKNLECSDIELAILESPVAPIVLLHNKAVNNNLSSGIAPNLNQTGAMLPYTPLYELLLNQFGSAIVATSGNISSAPIIYQDEKSIQELNEIADFILVNNREISVPQDDSVISYTPFKQQQIIIRRSRGLAPSYINADLILPIQSILSTGAMLKSTFGFLHQGNTCISQYLGDLEHFDAQENYRHTIRHFLQLFNCKPEVILCDKHPDYASTQFGEQLANDLKIPIEKIQHHIAHFGAVLGEHNLLSTQEPILGVIWDGTGLGDDGQIWGGEFFRYENYNFQRCYHFDYFDFILGDKMPKEPRISALAACWDVVGAENILKEKFSSTEWQVYTTLLEKRKHLQTSSVGRIFDAVASLLGIMDKQSYEGEAAMHLEAMAAQYFKKHGLDFSANDCIEDAYYYQIPTKSLIASIIFDLKKGKPSDYIAAKFHFSLMKLVRVVADNMNINAIAFSGGVFQNSVLVDLMIHYLSADYKLYFHQQLSPNDENISFGQLVCYQIQQSNNSLFQKKHKGYVLSDTR